MSSDQCCFVIKSPRLGWGENLMSIRLEFNKTLQIDGPIQDTSFANSLRPETQVVMSYLPENKQESLTRRSPFLNCWLNLLIKDSTSINSQNRHSFLNKAALICVLLICCLQITCVTYCDEITPTPTTITPIYELANPLDNVNITSYSKDDQTNYQLYGLTSSQDLDRNEQYDYYTGAYGSTKETQQNSNMLNAVDRLELPTQLEVTHMDAPSDQANGQKNPTGSRQMRMDYSIDQQQHDSDVGGRNDLSSAEAGATAALFSDDSPEQKMIDNMIDMAQLKSVGSAPSPSVSYSNNEATGSSVGSSSSSEKPPISTASTGTQQQQQQQQQSGASLGDQISAVSNLLQQAGQLGLSAAQQNAALSEALINGLSNTLINAVPARLGSRRPSASAASQTQHSPTTTAAGSRPALVGQGINGNIEYDSDNNQLNGFIEFPDIPGLGNLTNKRPNNVVKPLVLAALKTVPFKLGTVGWKILKLLLLKKLYKAHHPKSGEIMVEQEMKDTPISMSMEKSAKLGKGIKSQFKTSKMGQISSSLDDDFISNTIMGSTGGSDSSIKSGGGSWPSLLGGSSGSSGGSFDGSLPGSSSMIYQRQLLPPNAYGYGAGQAGSAPNPPAAAAAAAAALTAAAIQSHWMQQQQQQQQQQQVANSDSELDNSNNNGSDNKGTSSSNNGRQVGSSANRTNSTNASRKSKRSSQPIGSNNWLSSPIQAYAAAAAAANAAAILASHQQQLIQRDRQRYEAVMAGSSPFEFASSSHNINQVGDFQQALAGIMYRNLVDNTQQAQNNGKARPPLGSYASASGPLADFPDQSDPFYGSSMAAMSVNRDSPAIGMSTSSDPALGTLEGQWSNGLHAGDSFGNYPLAGDGPMQIHRSDSNLHQRHLELSPAMGETNPLGHHHHQTGIFSFNGGQMPMISPIGAMPEFDDTPAGSRLIGVALNDNKFSRFNDNKA